MGFVSNPLSMFSLNSVTLILLPVTEVNNYNALYTLVFIIISNATIRYYFIDRRSSE